MTTLDRPTHAWQPPALLGGVALALSGLVALLGLLDWPVPRRTTSGWQVADVPPSLLALVVGVGLGCLAVAALLATPRSLGSRPVTATWWVMAVASVAAQVWNDLYLAALAGPGGIIPVFNWAFTFVPALVVGLAARRHGSAVHLRATTSIGIVTLPMLALGWALAARPEGLAEALVGALWATAFFGVLPLIAVRALTRARR